MSYNVCAYRTDRDCRCTAWVREGQEYCDAHEKKIAEIEAMEAEVVEVINKAREK